MPLYHWEPPAIEPIRIDCRHEKLYALQELAELLPGNGGSHIAYNAVHKWTRRGCKGIELETTRLGCRIVTSLEAVQRFMDALKHQAEWAPKVPSRMTAHDRCLMEKHGWLECLASVNCRGTLAALKPACRAAL